MSKRSQEKSHPIGAESVSAVVAIALTVGLLFLATDAMHASSGSFINTRPLVMIPIH
jgi:hypothetical protein